MTITKKQQQLMMIITTITMITTTTTTTIRITAIHGNKQTRKTNKQALYDVRQQTQITHNGSKQTRKQEQRQRQQ